MTCCERPKAKTNAYRAGTYGALCTLAGALLSGPVAMLVVSATHPQPSWQGPEVFARSFHLVQTLPYLLGFTLVSGFIVLVRSLHEMAREEQRALTGTALVFLSVFAALVFLNYIVQTTFVPALARNYDMSDGPLLAAFTMSNPRSLGWGLEMWGYGVLGVATWLVAPVFNRTRLERAASWAFIANGPASIVPAVWTALDPGWVLTTPGIVSFAVWNVLVVAMSVLAWLALRKRLVGVGSPASEPGLSTLGRQATG